MSFQRLLTCLSLLLDLKSEHEKTVLSQLMLRRDCHFRYPVPPSSFLSQFKAKLFKCITLFCASRIIHGEIHMILKIWKLLLNHLGGGIRILWYLGKLMSALAAPESHQVYASKEWRRKYVDSLVFGTHKGRCLCLTIRNGSVEYSWGRSILHPLQAQNICINMKSVHNYVKTDIPQRLNMLTS